MVRCAPNSRNARASSASPARTRFLGVVAREDLPDLYASADAFVMPSTTETQGLVQAEALAAGTPVIAADAPQNRDVSARPARSSRRRPRRSPAPIAEPGATAGADLARTAAARFSIEAQIDRMLGLYESLITAARIA